MQQKPQLTLVQVDIKERIRNLQVIISDYAHNVGQQCLGN